MNNFVALSDAQSGNKLETTLNNIKAQAPVVATALFLVGKDLITQNMMFWFFFSLAVGIIFQVLGKTKTLTVIFGAIAFFFWVWGMGGLFDNVIPNFFGPATKTVIILGYHTIITALANLGKV